MNDVGTINGLILAGGKSSRMKTDKSLLEYHGKPQRDFLFELLTPFCRKVHLSCKQCVDIPPHYNPIPDQFDLDSPLNGILSAFQVAPLSAWLTVPVDMPWVDETTLKFLINHRNPKKIATCFWDSTGKLPEPLLTLWEPHATTLLSEFYTNNGFSPREFLVRCDANIVAAKQPEWLKNINSVQEFDQFRNSLHHKL